MPNSPDEDPRLATFLRQNHSIARPEAIELEDRVMSQIDLLITEETANISYTWRRYIIGGIGLIITGIVGTTIFQVLNPPETSIAELNQLNLYLEAHVNDLSGQAEIGTENYKNSADLDTDLFEINDL
jgi:hypothetical protein